VAAVIVAALGTALVYLYAQNKQETAVAATAPVRVLVATTTINSGTTGTAAAAASSFATREVPSGSVVPGALTDPSAVADLVALSPIYPGQQIIPQQWGTSGATNNLSIPAGKMAMSIQLSDPQRVAGFVAPGSSVAVFATLPDPSNGGLPGTRVLLPKVQVIAVGPTSLVKAAANKDDTTNAEQIPAAILTLALTEKEAAKVAFATQGGSLYLGLLGTNTPVAPGTGVDATTLYK
jgi:pilus assembly protein CpaB